MAKIGLYGVYYSKGVLTDGVLTGYSGVETMGKAISASFEPVDIDDNPLYANNGIAETDARAAAGGTLTLTLDKLTQDAIADLYGLTLKTETITIDGETVTTTGFDDDGTAAANPVGVAFVSWKQEANDRNIYDAVIYSYVTFNDPTDEFATMGESVEWGTPEISGTVSGTGVTGSYPWRKRFRFTKESDAIAFITDYFHA